MIYDDKRKYTFAEIIQVVTDVIFKRFSCIIIIITIIYR